MAVVTLKDLMDPLSKIEAAAQSTNEKLDALIAVSTGGSGGGDFTKEVVNQLEKQTDLLRVIASSGGNSSNANQVGLLIDQGFAQTELLTAIEANTSRNPLGGMFSKKGGKAKQSNAGATLNDLGIGAKLTAKAMMLWLLVPKKALGKFKGFVTSTLESFESVKPKKVEAGAKAVSLVSASAMISAKAMMKWLFVPEKAVDKFTNYIVKLDKALSKTQPKNAKKGAEALGAMGDSIMKFSKALALSAVLLIPGMLAIPFLILSMTVVGGAVALLGGKKLSQRISRGARTLDKVGDALKSFAIGIGLFALSTMFIILAPAILIGMVASLVLIPGAISLIGSKKRSKKIRRGALSLTLTGLALIPFAIGLIYFSAATKGMGIGDVLIQGAVILAIGGAAALVGKFGMSNILMGALAMAVNGLGLMVFSLGYTPFAEATKGLGLGDVLVQSGILIAIGGIMALAGLAVGATAGAALLGPVLYGAAGLALQELAPGLLAMKKVDYSKKDAEDLSFTLGAVAAAFSGVDPEAGFLSNIGNVFSRVVQSGAGVAAAAMYGAAGLALQELSKGLTKFKAVGFDEQDSKELAIALGSVSGAFAQAGGEPASPGGLFGAVFGNTFSPNATERGIDSVMDSGKALSEITKGLAAFLDLKKKYKLDASAFQEGGFLAVSIADTLGFLSKAFATIGGMEEEDGWGPFSWDENKVEKGIDAVKGSGRALSDITSGLKAFLDLQKEYGLTTESFQEGGYLQVAVADSLGFVSKAFGTIGGDKYEESDSWGPFSWDENKVEKGVDAVKGAGKELTNIASGLKTFQELVEKQIDFSPGGKLGKAVSNSLSFVSTAFSAIGEKEKTDGWFIFTWDENTVEKGIQAVKGAGGELNNIANGLKTFADMSDTVDFGKKGKLAKAVTNALSFVGSAFMRIGGMEETDGNWLFSWDENKVQKGIENVDGAGAALTDIAAGLQSFADLENPGAIAQGIESMFTSIGDTFAKYYKDPVFRTDLDHMQGFITELSTYAQDGSLAKAATDIQSISNAVNSIDSMKADSFAKLFKGAGELSSNAKAYQQLADAVEEIKDIMSSQGESFGDSVGRSISDVFGGGGGEKKESGGMGKTLARMNSTLGRLNSTMGQLPASIQSIKIVVED